MEQGATILAVDDDRSVLGLLNQALGGAGYRVLLADGGWNAVRVFEKSEAPIHLLLTDVIMPDLTGPVLAERLRARQPNADLVQRFVTLKGFTLLPKPFTVEGLLRVVQESLNGAQ